MDKEEINKSDKTKENQENSIDEKDKEIKSSSLLDEKEEDRKEFSLEEKIKELEDKNTRSLAELENQRRRFEKEKEDALEYGSFTFARESLNLIDNLERSKLSLENDESLKNSIELKKISEHLDIIYKDIISIFEKNNIKLIKSINEKLDPNMHQAMMEIEDDSKDPGTIVQEIQKGFMMKDRLLRPSLVGVAKKTSKKDDKKDDKNQQKNEEK
tara:strand:- start:244 stop:885 length:642 start_codon:yes stop_codon:yes gene_type:complete